MRLAPLAVAAALLCTPFAASAYLPIGKLAPDFQAQGALGGKVFTVRLKEALKKGPVVLYFYPAAFTGGCNIEANEFAQATEEFRKAGATVIGMSNDDLDTLKRFSVEECRNKFAVAAASPAVIKAYDVSFAAEAKNPLVTPEILAKAAARSNRTSYVIAPDGRIIFVHSDLHHREHVTKTLSAVQQWKARAAKKG